MDSLNNNEIEELEKKVDSLESKCQEMYNLLEKVDEKYVFLDVDKMIQVIEPLTGENKYQKYAVPFLKSNLMSSKVLIATIRDTEIKLSIRNFNVDYYKSEWDKLIKEQFINFNLQYVYRTIFSASRKYIWYDVPINENIKDINIDNEYIFSVKSKRIFNIEEEPYLNLHMDSDSIISSIFIFNNSKKNADIQVEGKFTVDYNIKYKEALLICGEGVYSV